MSDFGLSLPPMLLARVAYGMPAYYRARAAVRQKWQHLGAADYFARQRRWGGCSPTPDKLPARPLSPNALDYEKQPDR
jgi:hypothetical protein